MTRPRARYTAQEMRYAADIREAWGDKDEVNDMLRQAADAEEELAKVKASKERWMQYQETAAGERNACIDELRKKDAEIVQLKARLGAVVKIARESRISREVKRRGLRIYVEVDDIAIALDMGKVVKSLNSIDAILRAASGEPETENKQTKKGKRK